MTTTTPDERLTQSVRMQQLHPEKTIEQCAASQLEALVKAFRESTGGREPELADLVSAIRRGAR